MLGHYLNLSVTFTWDTPQIHPPLATSYYLKCHTFQW